MNCCDDLCNVQMINCTPLVANISLEMPPHFGVNGSPGVGPTVDFFVFWELQPPNTFLGNVGTAPSAPGFIEIPFSALLGTVAPAQGGVPPGGTTGMVLGKLSNADLNYGWIATAASLPPGLPNTFLTANGAGNPVWYGNIASLLPTGGPTGSFLIKNSINNFDCSFQGSELSLLPAGGAAGNILMKNSGANWDVIWGTGASSPVPIGLLPPGGTVGQKLVRSGAPAFTVAWEDTNYVQSVVSPSVNTSSTTSLMMGFGSITGTGPSVLTITKSGVVLVILYSYVENDTAGQYCEWSCRYGVGTPPQPNAPLIGNTAGTLQLFTSATAGAFGPVATAIVIPNLVWGTTYWFDFTKRVSGGNGSWGNPTLQVIEF